MLNNQGLASFWGAARATQLSTKLLLIAKGHEVRWCGWDGTVIRRVVFASEEEAAQEFDQLRPETAVSSTSPISSANSVPNRNDASHNYP